MADKIANGKLFLNIADIYKVMGQTGLQVLGGLGGSNIHTTVYLHGIGGNHLC